MLGSDRRCFWKKPKLIAALSLSVFVVISAFWLSETPVDGEPNPAEALAAARAALKSGNHAEAERLAVELAAQVADASEAWLIAGEAATKRKRFEEALNHYTNVSPSVPATFALAQLASGEILFHRGQFSKAEQCYREALKAVPNHAFAHERMAMLLGITGRRWESVPHLFELVKQGEFTLQHLVYLGSVENIIESVDQIRQLAAPDDPIALLGIARVDLYYNRLDRAEAGLRRVIDEIPEEAEAQVRWGELLLETASGNEFLEWQTRLPEEAESHPDLWVVRGLWLKEHGNQREATRCFWEAVVRDPNHQVANYQLGHLLNGLGESELADPFLDRHAKLDEVARTLERVNSQRLTPELVPDLRKLAESMHSLGRLWEASAWYQTIVAVRPDLSGAREAWETLRAELRHTSPPQTLASANPARQINLSSYPLPRWSVPDTKSDANEAVASTHSQIRFEDLALPAGIDFTYFRSPAPDLEGKRIFETTGGGVAVLDYDGDGWPDLYFTQGCQIPYNSARREHTNRLYRNLGNGRFEDVTEDTATGDNAYGQGVAVGDFTNDGFPDLYIANLGKNRLLRNNGDGTFHDVTEEAGISDEHWTTSCLIADLNGDGSPDVYDVNYLSGDDIYSKLCHSKSGMRVCSPSAFEAGQDQLYLNTGDGRFENVTANSGIVVADGKGLGIVAADFRDTGQLDLFVANDQVANFYFLNESHPGSGSLKLTEQARPWGLAYDRDGKTQACMGVAVADSNQNGLLDLFVTNFHDESNTLYLQQSAGGFLDGTRSAGLRTPGFSMLGFGTQFLDADLNGLPDLVVTNGHVDDFRYEGDIPYRMRPQVYRNVGSGRFEEIIPGQLGDFFEGAYLGRGLARLDWNRDGREDFAVSHLDSPAALVTNQTGQTGNFLALKLSGAVSSRDAIGTKVTLVVEGRTRFQQLTAGDGYQASNQRQLIFGLGSAQRVEELQIRWPSGTEQSFSDLPANQEWLAVEGNHRLFDLSLE